MINQSFFTFLTSLTLLVLASSCTTPPQPEVGEEDIEAWVGEPITALENHPYFARQGMFRTKTQNGTEIRNYSFFYDFDECFQKAGGRKFGDFVDEDAFLQCSSSRVTCNNLFYIREDKVVEYAPTGRCTTNETFRPQ